jgi:SPP1 family predicted phage head-tail adaptor
VQRSIGQFREKVRIDRPSNVSDGMGGFTPGWTSVAAGLPARISPTKGGEDVRAQRLSGVSTYDVWVRFSSVLASVGANCRVVDERSGRTFNVRWVANLDERDRFLTLTVEAGGLTDG